MKNLLMAAMVCLVFCQCETVSRPSDRRTSLTDSGLSPSERVRAARNRPLSSDPSDPLYKVRTTETGVGVSVFQF